MTDKQLLKFAAAFRDGILDGGPSDMMCAAVCWPLAGLLRCNGVPCMTVETKDVPTSYGTVNHVWIRLADGRVLDPTADQFGDFPAVYLGAPTQLHAQVDTHSKSRDVKQARPARVGSAVLEEDAPTPPGQSQESWLNG